MRKPNIDEIREVAEMVATRLDDLAQMMADKGDTQWLKFIRFVQWDVLVLTDLVGEPASEPLTSEETPKRRGGRPRKVVETQGEQVE